MGRAGCRGRRTKGYEHVRCISSEEAAQAERDRESGLQRLSNKRI